MKMNSIQENYIIAKATLEAVKEVQHEKYNAFLLLKGITMDDVDKNNFEALSAEYDVFAKEEIENTGLAMENVKMAEEGLIQFGLSIAPVKIRTELENGIEKFYIKRKEFIDLILKLDVSTLPEALRVCL